MTQRYYEGYNAAHESINKGKGPQGLFMKAECSPNYDDFDRGWQDACIEAGAQIP